MTKTIKSNINKAFTLIELIIIVGILTVFHISIGGYIKSEQNAEDAVKMAIILSDGHRLDIFKYIQNNGHFPENLNVLDKNTTSKYNFAKWSLAQSKSNIYNGGLTVQFVENSPKPLMGKSITFFYNGDWSCKTGDASGNNGVDPKYLISYCLKPQ